MRRFADAYGFRHVASDRLRLPQALRLAKQAFDPLPFELRQAFPFPTLGFLALSAASLDEIRTRLDPPFVSTHNLRSMVLLALDDQFRGDLPHHLSRQRSPSSQVA
ncbi:MAG: hypothetical protein JSR21_22135 [Proteobacteria bacterium]|nr:hypothetical protein [Pseudomonadota bacterium]